MLRPNKKDKLTNNGNFNGLPTLSLCNIVKKCNLVISPNASKRLSKSTIRRYVSEGLADVSPSKRGYHHKFLGFRKSNGVAL